MTFEFYVVFLKKKILWNSKNRTLEIFYSIIIDKYVNHAKFIRNSDISEKTIYRDIQNINHFFSDNLEMMLRLNTLIP